MDVGQYRESCSVGFPPTFSINPGFVVDGPFFPKKPKVPTPLRAVPRIPSPDKPLPVTPSSTSSSPILTDDNSPDSASPRDAISPTTPSPALHLKIVPTRLTKRNHALLDLIESERDYVSDLALIRDIYLPVALGLESPTSSTRTLPTPMGSSSSTSFGPPMTREDARIIFGNISYLAELADDFFARLVIALGSVVPNGEGEDTIGAVFIETIPYMEPQYMLYITHHPAALEHLNALPQTPALVAYHKTTRALAEQLSPVWDLPSILIKPVQRLLKYALLLHAIIEETPNSHGDKDNLRRAKAMIEEVLRAINEGQRRREFIKEVFAAGKPAELLKKKGIGIVGRVRGGVGRSTTQDDSEEAVQVAQMERDISRIDAFIQQFTEETVDWVKSVQVLMSALRVWAECFGRIIGLCPDVTAKSFDAFFVVVDKQLLSLCTGLEDVIREQLLPKLSALLDTVKRPRMLLDSLHALEPHHLASLQHLSAKGRPPPALNEASTTYVALRAQLYAELPAYMKLLNNGVTLCVGQVANWQAGLWRDVRAQWSEKLLPGGLKMRTHALLDLIESERAYASDLALIRDIHLPVALGHEPPIPTPPQSSSSSTRTLSTASGSSSTSVGPPMTREDARIIFGNISDLAEFADDFIVRLEIALGSVLPNGEGEDTIGALFIETIPRMEPQYMLYLTHHPAALEHLNALPQTPALIAYHNTTHVLAQQLSHAWDLPSLLIKPVQRLLKYAFLLRAIIQETPNSHGDKENLRRAKAMVEDMSRAINEARRRREIVKEVFAVGKLADLLKKKGLGIVGRVRGGIGKSITQDDSGEAVQVAQMERDISRIDAFIQKFTKETVEWIKSVQVLMSALRVWAEGFGRVIGLGPDVTSEAFDAFLVVVDKQLSAIGTELEAVVRERLLPQLSTLLETIKRPTLLLDTLHALEPYHFASLQQTSARGRPPSALNEASMAYVALRAQLCAELPAYLKLLNSGVSLCVGQLAKWQARLWRDVRARWSELWDALSVVVEINAGREETERVWQARWEEAARDLRALNIINPEKITPRSRQERGTATPPSPTTVHGAANAITNSLEPARTAPANTTMFPEPISSQNIVESLLPSLPQRTAGARSMRPSEAHHALRRHPHPPVPPAPQLMVSSRWYSAQALYSCRVTHECDPPEGVQYFGLPFFRLSLDDVYHVLKEAGHPSRHPDLPLLVDEGEDCLLLVRDSTGEIGWALASFLYPVD